jgi:acetylglutamate kinase
MGVRVSPLNGAGRKPRSAPSGRRRHRSPRPWVVKTGGRVCDEPAQRRRLARACADVAAPLVLVHGGGAQVTRLQRAMSLESRFVDGRRVTTPEDLAIVEMVLSGAVNQALVRALTAAGRPAAGLSGCDGGFVTCDLVPALGRVGTPARVRTAVVSVLLAAGLTPVVSPISLGPDGEAVNVNADEVAAAVAAALGAERLLLLSDVDGVRAGAETRSAVASDEIADLVASGHVTDGMIPKLRAAATALAGGVGEVRIAGFAGVPLAAIRGTLVRAGGGPS